MGARWSSTRSRTAQPAGKTATENTPLRQPDKMSLYKFEDVYAVPRVTATPAPTVSVAPKKTVRWPPPESVAEPRSTPPTLPPRPPWPPKTNPKTN